MNSSASYQKQTAILLICMAFAVMSFFFFGNHVRSWGDASEYDSYATNIAGHGQYSEDGLHFSTAREPGYPLFVALLYRFFGIDNFFAVSLSQCLLIGLLGYLVYRLLKQYDETIAIIAGVCISFFPSYGYYATEILTESLFTFLLGALLLTAVRIVGSEEKAAWQWYALFGVLCGYETLVRVQFLFFLAFVAVCYGLYLRRKIITQFSNIGVAALLFIVIVGSWSLYVHQHTGTFALTEGRQERALNERAVRARLSYGELTHYAVAWVKRSVSGGVDDPFLDVNDFRYIDKQYALVATSSAAIARIKDQNISTILHNPGHYLYGNLIEMMKLAYIEHDYSDSQSRYFRPIVYALTYGFFIFGIYQFFRRRGNWELKLLSLLSFIFLIYNYLTISAFDAIPRYNTPYMMFYIIVGFVGVLLWRQKPASGKISAAKVRK